MPALVILGAGGLVGRAILAGPPPPLPVTAIARTAQSDRNRDVKWVALDLLVPGALTRELATGDVVVNLAYAADASHEVNVALVDAVVSACVAAGVARLVHCSTAVVSGSAEGPHVDESTPCLPVTPYERTKLALEARVVTALAHGVDAGILRPTVVVGPGGQNLLTLARAIQSGNAIVNYLRASVHGRRAMHLVAVGDVAAAAVHLALLPTPLNGGVYIVAADDSPDNEFGRAEQLLRHALGVPPRRVPLVPVPARLLTILLKLRGRSDTSLDRRYDSRKLQRTGFRSVTTLADAIRDFGRSLRT